MASLDAFAYFSLFLAYCGWVVGLGAVSTLTAKNVDCLVTGIIWVAVWFQFLVVVVFTLTRFTKLSILESVNSSFLGMSAVIFIIINDSARKLRDSTTGTIYQACCALLAGGILIVIANAVLMLCIAAEKGLQQEASARKESMPVTAYPAPAGDKQGSPV